MNWFERMKSGILTRIKREIPEAIWEKCKGCGETSYQTGLESNSWICPYCGCHYPIGHARYVDLLADPGSFRVMDESVSTADPLKFRDHRRYGDRIRESQRRSGINEAIYTGTCTMGDNPVCLGVMDTKYILGSLGGATGEKIARLVDCAIAEGRSLVLVCQSGGARMQESTFSLMQMAKVSARLKRLSDAGLLYVCVLTDPTYGGVTASFAMLGDVLLAEPGARIGFAGPAVIKQFMGIDDLPNGFQIAENVLEHGFVDKVVPRNEMAATLTRLIDLLAPPSAGAESRSSIRSTDGGSWIAEP
ncbi:MAG: acetyl-CoA carboxylase carboxyltransferase subunit beta [Candidatus Latescibacterota bacterium]|nr:acetyl-CoA carboxylase carboxyltransferase subunit beta [Candidatus Latescibacterota bacterium]